MWTDVVTTIISLMMILIFAYSIVFVLQFTGLYKPNEHAIIRSSHIGDINGGIGSL
jgi:hypothetical protein